MKFDRNKRISEEIKKIVSNLILNEIKDPRIPQFTSITHVETTRDHRYVYIYISFLQDNINIEEAMKGLNKAKGFIRREIGRVITLHYTPEPVFKIDDSIKNAMHLEEVIHSLDINHENDDNE
ncbi:MAG: 30S ribosome-binding factor RbfA [Clostridiales bacterium]|nr:30S ribosome-binding factor RbfA [Clostridiales bacterium]